MQGPVGVFQRKSDRVCFDRDCSGFAQEIEPVLPRIGRHASNNSFAKDLAIVVERGNRRHVNASDGECAASFQRS